MICKLEKFTGTVIGGAIGNAMGMPFKNLHHNQIKNLYGEDFSTFLKPVENHLNAIYPAGQFTDETQIMMLTSEVIIEHGKPLPEKVAEKMVELLNTNGWISPGRSVIAACKKLKNGKSWKNSGSFRDGSKALAFVPPIVLCYFNEPERMIEYIKELTRIIYTFPKVIAGGICFGYFLRSVLLKSEVSSLQDLLEETAKFMEDIDMDYAEIIRWVKRLSAERSEDAFLELGTGYSILETFPSSIYSILRFHSDFLTPIKKVVRFGDNSDTTGFLTGTMIGGLLGYDNIPEDLKKKLVDFKTLKDLSEKLHNKCCG